MRSDDLYLAEILDAADLISGRVHGVDLVAWNADDQKRDAVLLRLMTIGEAARSLSETFRASHVDLPWRRMIGFRNVVVHEYFAVEWATVWRIVQEQIPPLREPVHQILAAKFPVGYDLWRSED